MNIVVDENIPRHTVVELRGLGHVVVDVRETADKGADDAVLWNLAQRERSLLVTTDKGFIQRQNEPHAGVLIVRLKQPNRLRIHHCVMRALAHFAESSWPGQTVVVRDRSQSVRRARC